MVSTLPFLLVNKRGSAAAVTTDTVRDENHVFLSIFLFLVKIAVALVPVPYPWELGYRYCTGIPINLIYDYYYSANTIVIVEFSCSLEYSVNDRACRRSFTIQNHASFRNRVEGLTIVGMPGKISGA